MWYASLWIEYILVYADGVTRFQKIIIYPNNLEIFSKILKQGESQKEHLRIVVVDSKKIAFWVNNQTYFKNRCNEKCKNEIIERIGVGVKNEVSI